MSPGPLDHPRNIGPYRVLGVLGEGGMGTVYEAEQSEPVRRRVAVKMMKLGMDTREVIARFEAERQTLAVMEHPGIAKVFDAGVTDEGRPYFVMELVRGVRIDTFCDDHRLGLGRRVELLAQACDAVQHAHGKGVIHRDLKPANVLLTEVDGHPRCTVIDFGVARAVAYEESDVAELTRAGETLGTPAYMSPEQLAGDPIDTRTDIYALGVMLYEQVSGSLPHEKSDYGGGHQLLAASLKDPPRPARRFDSLSDTQEPSPRFVEPIPHRSGERSRVTSTGSS